MNKQEKDILCFCMKNGFRNQRELAERTGYSLGTANQALRNLISDKWLTEEFRPTNAARELLESNRPRRGIILAAGLGMRMVPINTQTTKGLLEVKGERLIERLICQLHQAGVFEITVVVGFMKEQYEYLIDKYQVDLIVNTCYGQRNNLYSMSLVLDKLEDAYVIPCDLWCGENPFHTYELYSWYMVSQEKSGKSPVRINRRQMLARCDAGQKGNKMIGIAYLQKREAEYVRARIREMILEEAHDDDFWEEALWNGNAMVTFAKCVSGEQVHEINTYEQLRDLDTSSDSLKSETIQLVADALEVWPEAIQDIKVLKKGMTNRSFICRCWDKKYIMRIPGEGTGKLIDRKQEYEVYQALQGYNICDRVRYINPANGYKLTEYLEGAHVCDARNEDEVRRCMGYLRAFHERGLQVDHAFDLWEHIAYYESLWNGEASVYQDYEVTKGHVFELKDYIEEQEISWTLTHIDAVPDNFLLLPHGEIRLIDWEYAGMQDPHVDIAMFAVYALYDRKRVDWLINAYFTEGATRGVRLKIYCYIAVCGLLWSNWCEFKRQQGVEFGEYSLRQYRYAKEYYRIFQEEYHAHD